MMSTFRRTGDTIIAIDNFIDHVILSLFNHISKSLVCLCHGILWKC